MAKDPNDVKFVSPFGTARYPWLAEPDTKYDEDGKFHLGVILSDDDAEALEAKFKAVFKAAFGDKAKGALMVPIKETEDGQKYLVAKSGYKPKVYDAKKKPLPIIGKDEDGEPIRAQLGGGSRVRVAGMIHPFIKGANKGVTIYLYDVQYTKLVERGAGGLMDAVDDDAGADDDASDDTDTSSDDGELDI